MTKEGGKEIEPSKALNIVLLPDEKTQEKAIELSHKISEEVDTEFILNETTYRPHITIYQGSYPPDNIDLLLEELQRLSAEKSPFPIKMEGFQVSYETFVFWNTVKTEALQEFHEQILALANPIRKGQIPDSVMKMLPNLPPEEQDMIRNTGSILNKHLFLPHITLSRIKKPDDKDRVLKLLSESPPTVFNPEKLTIATLGDHGTISDSIAEFELSG